MQRQMISTIIGKSVKKVAQLRGGGSALPGLVVEKIDPDFIRRTLEDLPQGVVIISGTNGKTTTTKIVVELLESVGLQLSRRQNLPGRSCPVAYLATTPLPLRVSSGFAPDSLVRFLGQPNTDFGGPAGRGFLAPGRV